MDENATMYPGRILATVQLEGVDEKDKTYVMKTMNFSVNVEEALCEYGADGVYRTWATDIEIRIADLEKVASSSKATFIGTKSEYATADSAGEIPSGMFVTLTDA